MRDSRCSPDLLVLVGAAVLVAGCRVSSSHDESVDQVPFAHRNYAAKGRPHGGWPEAETPTSSEARRVLLPIDLPVCTPFNEALVSWNVDTPAGTGFTVEIRVGRSDRDSWAPFLELGEWGETPPTRTRVVEWEGGKVDVDYFRSKKRFDRLQVRVSLFAKDDDSELPRLDRIALTTTDTTAFTNPRRSSERRDGPADWQRRVGVPFRSQRDVANIGSRICSPTSVSMVMEYCGVDRPTAQVAAVAYDRRHDIYGNWPRAVQAAYSMGVPGRLARFDRWESVERLIARGCPLVISVRVKDGELVGAPYKSTSGHLLVLCGFDEDDGVAVNDPAAPSATSGATTYAREDLETVWMRRGGTAYVFVPPGTRER
jgi:hypothetical protein